MNASVYFRTATVLYCRQYRTIFFLVATWHFYPGFATSLLLIGIKIGKGLEKSLSKGKFDV